MSDIVYVMPEKLLYVRTERALYDISPALCKVPCEYVDRPLYTFQTEICRIMRMKDNLYADNAVGGICIF